MQKQVAKKNSPAKQVLIPFISGEVTERKLFGSSAGNYDHFRQPFQRFWKKCNYADFLFKTQVTGETDLIHNGV